MPKPTATNRLLEAFVSPATVATWTEADWGLAFRQARSANLVASLGDYAETGLGGEGLAAQAHLRAARNLIAQRNAAVVWEAGQILKALAKKQIQPTFLKGTAYVLAGIPLARHRHFSDIDVMVPKEDMAEAEKQLMLAGWLPSNTDAYDQRYYRQWMHEVPPLRHIRRGTVLDLHHAITPLTARYQARTSLLFDARSSIEGVSGAFVLSPPDMILHAAAHLFAEGEAENALRNLLDISELLDHFSTAPTFEAELAARAFELGLSRPLFLAIRYLARVLLQERRAGLVEMLEPARPGLVALLVLDGIYDRIFTGQHPTQVMAGSGLARAILYLRGHWLRMPLRLLLPHLWRKAISGEN